VLLGEKQDVKVWLGWLEQMSHGEVEAVETPIGFLPKYEDLRVLFAGIGKEYPLDLYNKQFSLYTDKILAVIELQEEAYRREGNVPRRLFEIYREKREGIEALRARFGPVISVEQVMEATRGASTARVVQGFPATIRQDQTGSRLAAPY
jgi:phosphoenolpyruvate carboxykinase (GTP)